MLDAFFAAQPGLSLKRFKSLGEVGLELDQLARINVVIGKNNSGKSAILDAVALLCSDTATAAIHHHNGEHPQFRIRRKIGELASQRVFTPHQSGGFVEGNHWETLGRPVADSFVSFDIDAKTRSEFKYELSPAMDNVYRDYNRSLVKDHPNFVDRLSNVGQHVENPFSGLRTIRLAAERDLVPEAVRSDKNFAPNGVGLVGLLAYLITSSNEKSSVVEEEFRAELNKVLEPDITISSIRTYQDNGVWEIYLASGKQPIAMSNSGSGLKTVVHTVAALWLMPRLKAYEISDTIFLFEELENNLHPALQRRLLSYVADAIAENGCVFLATHSSVAIDMFNKDENAKIIHVTHADGAASAVLAHTTVSLGGIIDDLDVRASDILQSNCIVWVEGPSDRIYFNRWMTLITDGELVEGVQYQCLFYGGRLLAHLSAEYGEDDAAEAIEILRANRHAIILIDSDRAAATAPINATKTRVKSEIERIGGYAWVTDGREIENYISAATFAKLDPRMNKGIGVYGEVEKKLTSAMKDDAKRHTRSKAVLAGNLAPLIELDELDDDLKSHLTECARLIRRWNGHS